MSDAIIMTQGILLSSLPSRMFESETVKPGQASYCSFALVDALVVSFWICADWLLISRSPNICTTIGVLQSLWIHGFYVSLQIYRAPIFPNYFLLRLLSLRSYLSYLSLLPDFSSERAPISPNFFSRKSMTFHQSLACKIWFLQIVVPGITYDFLTMYTRVGSYLRTHFHKCY